MLIHGITAVALVALAVKYVYFVSPKSKPAPSDWKHEIACFDLDSYVQEQHDIYFGGSPKERHDAGFEDLHYNDWLEYKAGEYFLNDEQEAAAMESFFAGQVAR